MLELCRPLGGRFLLLNYDRLCADPMTGLRALLEFLDVPEGHFNRPNTMSIDDLYHVVSSPAYRPENDYNRPVAHLNKLYRTNPLLDERRSDITPV